MTVRILAIGTAVPTNRLRQDVARDFFAAQPGVNRVTARLIGAAFDHSSIETRHSVIGGIGTEATAFTDENNRLRDVSTGERNLIYRQEVPQLYEAAAREALDHADISATDVTHVITASCTGFFSPGPDFLLIKHLGIRRDAERYHIGFMGCSAAFPALRAATHICDAQPNALILVVCAELCSLHMITSNDPEQIVASAVFGDGAAAAIVTPQDREGGDAALEIGEFSTVVTSEGENDMDWTIGDHGFELRLSAEVPRIIGREISAVVASLAPAESQPLDRFDAWAVHPGGRSILDRVEHGVGLPATALEHSRAVLRDYGNMSSATILFILQRMLADNSLGDGSRILGMCFGPGLTVETAQFTRRTPIRGENPRREQ